MTINFSIFFFNLSKLCNCLSPNCNKTKDPETIEDKPDIYIHEVTDIYPDIIETVKVFPQNNQLNIRTDNKINLNDYPNKIPQFEGFFKVYLNQLSEKNYHEYCFTDNEGYILQPGIKREYIN
ncbi:hypothetical protein H012_gp798 [Acanthamoeba polyphaga moumouvirus]|uniref:Uncharacterized protein n=1 Tax=Acanthamoeba polyphaga moumouvirus TaxID=1269028 RepID=L7RBT6_9VIRU|nr:hypothetical protein H012_gp798 [Acanthamoeba polyphaga moumouvirus]AGC01667.1 hypothetical protein Moumou_00123 [Acanthamoeba polyphaga moumouvirus]AQN68003.1 hypothetical protein [Saudi moumouvirus]